MTCNWRWFIHPATPADDSNANTHAVWVYNRALSAAEQASIAANPWQMLLTTQPTQLAMTTTVTCSATDARGNTGIATFTVTVTP